MNIVVCASLVPDPLQMLQPVTTPQGPGLANEQMLPSVLDPWAACALYEAAALAKTQPGSKVYLVALAPKAKLQQLMMSVAQKAAFELVAVNAPAGGFNDALATAEALANAIKPLGQIDLLFGGCASASRDAGVTIQFVAEKLGITEHFMAVDELKMQGDGSFTVKERVEGGKYLVSTCKGFPAAISWATGNLPEPPNNPQIGMMNMRGIMPALMKAPVANVQDAGLKYDNVQVPAAKRDTIVKKDMTPEAIAQELADWLKA